MPIELYWDDDAQTVLLAEFEGRWTWDDLHDVLDKIKKVVQKTNAELSAIIDLRKGVSLPTSLLDPVTYEQAQRVLSLAPNGTGPVVVVGVHPLLQTIFDQLRQLDPAAVVNVRFAETMKAARRMIYPAG